MANKYNAEIFINGIASRLLPFMSIDSIWDKTRTPEGKHIVGIEEFSAPARFFSASHWENIRDEFARRMLQEWQIYAPNMTPDNVIACRVFTPYDTYTRHINMHEGSISCGDMIASQQDRFRPIPELSGYRMPIKNLYLCSSAAHPGVGTSRGSSYCCYQVIATNFGLKRFEGE